LDEKIERVRLPRQERDIIRSIMKQYAGKTPITEKSIQILYNRASNRGYDPTMIYIGLKTVICKNYLRSEYQPPHGDITQEVLHERMYIEDWELREIVKGNVER
jgi:hypothetical protein